MSISLVTRADDLGSSHAANLAIAGAAVTGDFMKNVSCMAVGPLIEEAADLLKGCRSICFGLHATLNSEEIGWRGYALERLQSRWNALTSSLIVGLVWALWHLPLFMMVGTDSLHCVPNSDSA